MAQFGMSEMDLLAMKGMGEKIQKLEKDLAHAHAQLKDYEHALINVAKLAGVCWAADGRPLHDVAEVADRALDKHQAPLWMKVRDLPFMDLTVDRDTGEVSLIKRPTKRLPVAKKRGKKR